MASDIRYSQVVVEVATVSDIGLQYSQVVVEVALDLVTDPNACVLQIADPILPDCDDV